MIQLLRSKTSHTKTTVAISKVKRMKAFVRLKKDNRCKDLAYVDELAIWKKLRNIIHFVKLVWYNHSYKRNEKNELQRNCLVLFESANEQKLDRKRFGLMRLPKYQKCFGVFRTSRNGRKTNSSTMSKAEAAFDERSQWSMKKTLTPTRKTRHTSTFTKWLNSS